MGDAFAVGTKYRGTVKVMGRKLPSVQEITEVDEHERVHARSIDSPVPHTLTWLFEPAGDGCRYTMRVESEGGTGFFGKFSDAIVARTYASKAQLEGLRRPWRLRADRASPNLASFRQD